MLYSMDPVRLEFPYPAESSCRKLFLKLNSTLTRGKNQPSQVYNTSYTACQLKGITVYF